MGVLTLYMNAAGDVPFGQPPKAAVGYLGQAWTRKARRAVRGKAAGQGATPQLGEGGWRGPGAGDGLGAGGLGSGGLRGA